ncbi:MAG: tRNA (adenosine(37)-N6)-threonylcarbamoyltransferase complex dimerization subunit type 1 TsaB [Clostridiales bacterium]|nr:tRNA (adenosine(37)-N6)-threonylcarbamoyltransferase complex dimerization subunit type 1 TsaB [Clostridiales bacterium]
MLILACDTSNSSCCAGVYEDGKELAFELSMEKKTHSETFMPLVKRVIETAGKTPSDIERIAVTAGPGSFTGIRIGLAAVKGMALALRADCIPVSSTLALALSVENISSDPEDTLLLPCFDARNNRVFASVVCDHSKKMVISEGAYDAGQLADRIAAVRGIDKKKIIVAGDGAETMRPVLEGKNLSVKYAPGCVILPKGVFLASADKKAVSGAAVKAAYCAVSSAERLKK